jgi:Cu2+-exporting ATPase
MQAPGARAGERASDHAEHAQHRAPQGGTGAHTGHMTSDFRNRFWICLAVTLPILLLSEPIQAFLGIGRLLAFRGDTYVLFALSSFVFFYGGKPFLAGFAREVRAGAIGMMTLISVAITTAYAYSAATVFGLEGMPFFWELATLIDIMLLGHWIEMRSVAGASRALEELARLLPSDAHKLMPDGSVRDVPLEELAPGDKVLVKPGEKVPVDGRVVEGVTSVDESLLTGESKPVNKARGSEVIGGAINGEGSITVEVSKTGKDSFLSQVIDLVREAQESKSRTQDLANRAAFILTVVALGGGALTLAAWLAFMRSPFAFALERSVTVMVIACPHALGLAVPLVVAISTTLAATHGLLIRDRAAFEKGRAVDALIFDKTGTLTEGRFGVTDVVVFALEASAAPVSADPAGAAPTGGPAGSAAPAALGREELLALAASVEARSEHPIAKAIATASQVVAPVRDFRAIPGVGAEAKVKDRHVMIVSRAHLAEQGTDPRAAAGAAAGRLDELADQGKTVVYVVVDGRPSGAIALADIIRPESAEAIARLKEMGVRCMMLTGDHAPVARWVADQLGLDEFFAEVLPKDKSAKVKEVQAKGLVVAMTGDGVNDAPALAQADLGIAIGAGTDVAVETADVVLVRSDPRDVVSLIGLSRATYRKMVQNLWWATGYNVIAIPLAAGVLYAYGILLSPALGAVFMSASTVIVAINARLLKMA